jgi:hypothetical protein
MATYKVKGYITATKFAWENTPSFSFQTWMPREDDEETIAVREHSIEVEIEDGFDMRPLQVKQLEEAKRMAQAAFAAKVKELDDRIASLLALEAPPVTVGVFDEVF